MNRALAYLWWSLLVRRSQRWVHSLRRPLSLAGFLAVAGLLGFLFHFRDHEIIGQLARRENLMGGALVMLCGSLFKGFLQRGLVCEPADIEFVFTSPFTPRQVVLYRLLPNYLFALVQSLVFLALFGAHFHHPWVTAFCLALFQAACFHLATAAAIFGGALCETAHYRVRWMMLGTFFLLAALYLRLEWGFRIIPSFCSTPIFQLLFYPAVTLPDAVTALPVHQWVARFWGNGPFLGADLRRNALYCGGFAAAASASLWLLLRLKANIFEAALETTQRAAGQRRRRREGLSPAAATQPPRRSFGLPRWGLFHGVGALAWKNLVAARRARREMWLAGCFVLTYTGFFTALLWIYHDLARKAGGVAVYEARSFTSGIALFLAALAFFLQRMFPFDFRRDGAHLLTFRTLPHSALAVAVAQIAVPTLLCLAAQACGVIPLILLGKLDGPTLALVVLGYPVVSLALNSVWNLHYLLAAARRARGQAASASAVGTVLVVALSFLVFYPAGWTTTTIANHVPEHLKTLGFTLAAGGGLVVQSAVDLLLVLGIASCFQRIEICGEG